MYFPETFDQAHTLGESAMEKMRQFKQPATPNNYAIWYVYHSGGSPDLVRDLDDILQKQEPLTSERSVELYDRYFGTAVERQAIENTGQSLEEAIQKLIGFIDEAGEDSAQFSDALAEFSGELAANESAENARAIIASIVEQTKKVINRQDKLHADLVASTQEVEELRETIQSARREALTDALTGISNRKAFDEAVRMMTKESQENQTGLCLMMLDIDNFKQFNDTYGHPLGDQVLRLVARTFQDCIKGRDIAARYGGEEFAILLPETDLAPAAKLADKIRETVANKRIVNRQSGQTLGQITLSAGVALFKTDETIEEFIHRADAALYTAKRSGRNRVVREDQADTNEAA